MIADIYIDCQMLLIIVIGDLHSLDISSLCRVYFFFNQGHVTAYFGFPTMPGMIDAIGCHMGISDVSPLDWMDDPHLVGKWLYVLIFFG